MKLRDISKHDDLTYDIGLDLGTNSVGWAILDADGELCRFKGKLAWGSRLFPEGKPASDARVHRGQRRRYVRRRWRLELLQEFFAEEINRVDPDFFVRMNQSRLWRDDRNESCRDYDHLFFNGSDFTERDYYNRFPTIYHLRAWLMDASEKADLRLVYLAFHNIVKHRGNFLRQGQAISSKDAKMADAVRVMCEAVARWSDESEIDCSLDDSIDASVEHICDVLQDSGKARKDKAREIAAALCLGAAEGKRASAIASSILGLKFDPGVAFGPIEGWEKKGIALSDDEAVESFSSVCPDEARALFDSLMSVYASFVLQGLLSLRPGQSLSANKVAEYERYREDLKTLKGLVKTYAREEYDSFFRGAHLQGVRGARSRDYDPATARGYTKYNLGAQKSSYDAFKKDVKSVLGATGAAEDGRYADMMRRFDEGTFLRRLKTSDNGSIYHQLHLEELQAIIDNQGRHYPFLLEEREKIESLVTFRIPYYVGPLQMRNAAVDPRTKEKRFAWSVRKQGMEQEAIKPWNWDQVIDKSASAAAFIERMTGMCTYLHGEPVLPKCSLLYEEFCVLNELNGAKMTIDGDNFHRIESYEDRRAIVRDLFCNGRVSYKKVESWFARERGLQNVHVEGGQGETGFESRMSSYIFFRKDVFGTDEIADADIPMVEEIIWWSTLFEDRDIFEDKLREKYGNRLSDQQIKTIKKKRFTGWGRLSRKLLDGIAVETNAGPKTIMDVLREGDPTNGHRSRPMVLMEILRDETLKFDGAVADANRAYNDEQGGLSIADIPGSPALRRTLNQAMRLVGEIVGIAGKPPAHIYVEVTRDENENSKGKRTSSRERKLRESYDLLKREAPEVWDRCGKHASGDLGKQGSVDLSDERVMLYFVQCGRCMYSGKAIDIHQLFDAGLYEVDHILPQSYIKDDSLENKALVLRSENQRKAGSMLLDASIRSRQKEFWTALKNAKLIGEKKWRNLMRDRVTDSAMKGFIARQLVETGQIAKYAQELLADAYPDADVRPIKASVSSQLREACGLAKSRNVNAFHHAHDAFLACRIGQFVRLRHPSMFDNPIGMTHVIRDFVRKESEEYRRSRKMPGSAGFVVKSFLRSSGFDAGTGEVYDGDALWNAEKTVGYIRWAFDVKDCFVTRMPQEDSGAFWDATIYSPRSSGKDLTLPLKEDLDPMRYGGYSSEKFAYFFVYVAKHPKKGNLQFEFAPVPVRIASSVSLREGALAEYAQELCRKSGLEFVRIAKRKICKYQLIEMKGERFYLTGKKEVRNAFQLALSSDMVAVLSSLEKEQPIDEGAVDLLFEQIIGSLKEHSRRVFDILGLGHTAEAFRALDLSDKNAVINSILAVASGSSNRVDMTVVGGSKAAGCMQPAFSKELAGSDFFFIDQSVTGMFERRYRLEL